MAKADIEMDIQRHEDSAGGRHDDEGPLIKYYRASEVLPGPVPALQRLLRKGPATCAAIQSSSGILSFGIGVVFAASFGINLNFLTLFRVPIITGIMFIFAGILSNLLYKHPGLLQTCFIANIACLVVSGIGTILLIVDLRPGGNTIQNKMEVLALCVTLMDMIIAVVLIYWFYREKRDHKQ
ncbi:uncharacterized protein si:ch211-269k10.4 [Onychostoma macrolepis]|uniref:Uncharacterized protein n=1 Tax=Onychostoma macrolepis TaxID=369639 RepID=A0A7J6C5Y9_9TELE|nr:uncharacterized protein si:ch211-269k10.4 [Onychostoma macrolepis]KAF4102709.1 hypothetical protein G5714_015592 [Onychostoma macrolepis]